MTVRRVMGIETEYGIVVPGNPAANPMVASGDVVTAYAASRGIRPARAPASVVAGRVVRGIADVANIAGLEGLDVPGGPGWLRGVADVSGAGGDVGGGVGRNELAASDEEDVGDGAFGDMAEGVEGDDVVVAVDEGFVFHEAGIDVAAGDFGAGGYHVVGGAGPG